MNSEKNITNYVAIGTDIPKEEKNSIKTIRNGTKVVKTK